jgi:hypothetical protein
MQHVGFRLHIKKRQREGVHKYSPAMSCIISQKYQMMANHMLKKSRTREAIVRDNVPISYKEWKGKADNLHIKNLLWDEIIKHLTLPEGVEPTNVKRWTVTRMATQFQKFKQQLDKDYIKKNRTPNWIEYLKLKEH